MPSRLVLEPRDDMAPMGVTGPLPFPLMPATRLSTGCRCACAATPPLGVGGRPGAPPLLARKPDPGPAAARVAELLGVPLADGVPFPDVRADRGCCVPPSLGTAPEGAEAGAEATSAPPTPRQPPARSSSSLPSAATTSGGRPLLLLLLLEQLACNADSCSYRPSRSGRCCAARQSSSCKSNQCNPCDEMGYEGVPSKLQG